MSYPKISDPKFYQKINSKREFSQNKIPLDKTIEQLCSSGKRSMELLEHQKLIRNYLSPFTPYRNLLLIAEPGTGKTLSAIAVADGYTQVRPVHVFLESSVYHNFIGEYSRFYKKPLNHLEFNIKTLGILTRETQQLLSNETGISEIKRKYSNSLIIVDEVHNLREDLVESDSQTTIKRYDAIYAIVALADNCKLLLMSATPMYDSPREIVSLMNLFILNEQSGINSIESTKQFVISQDQVFDDNNKLKPQGIKLLQKYFRGAVSYLSHDERTYPTQSFPKESQDFGILKTIKLIDCPMSDLHKEFYLKRIHENISRVRQYSDVYDTRITKESLTYSALANSQTSISGKFFKLLQNIKKTTGTMFVYSDYKKSVLDRIKLMLQVNGYTEYDEKKPSPKSFIYLQGDTNSSLRSKLIETFNSVDNKNGNIIRIIIGSSVLKEGITLKNIRTVHILEPWYNVSRLVQIWGRAIRACSHIGLPESKRNVEIYLYASTFGTNNVKDSYTTGKSSYDLYWYYHSEQKQFAIDKVIHVLRGLAVDCSIHSEYNRNVGDGIICSSIETGAIVEDSSTFNLYFDYIKAPEINALVREIKQTLKTKFIYTIQETNNEILSAINKVLEIQSFKNKDGKRGNAVLRGKYLFFQSPEYTSGMGIYERLNYPKLPPRSKQLLKTDLVSMAWPITRQSEPETEPEIRQQRTRTIGIVHGNYEGIIKDSNTFLMRKTNNTGKNTTGRNCMFFTGEEYQDIFKDIGIPDELVSNYYQERNGKIIVKHKQELCNVIRKFYYPNYIPRTQNDTSENNTMKTVGSYKVSFQNGKLKIHTRNLVKGRICQTVPRQTIEELASLLEIPSANIAPRMLCQKIKERLFP